MGLLRMLGSMFGRPPKISRVTSLIDDALASTLRIYGQEPFYAMLRARANGDKEGLIPASMSPTDARAIDFFYKALGAGIASLKLDMEGASGLPGEGELLLAVFDGYLSNFYQHVGFPKPGAAFEAITTTLAACIQAGHSVTDPVVDSYLFSAKRRYLETYGDAGGARQSD